MIAQQDCHPSPSFGRTPFHLHKQIHNRADVATAVEEVTRLNQAGLSTGPAAVVVDEPGVPKQFAKRIVRPVDVPDGDETRASRLRPDRGKARCQEQHERNPDTSEPSHRQPGDTNGSRDTA